MCEEFINYNDKLYIVYRKVKEGRIKEENFDKIRELWHCDFVVKSKTQDLTQILFLKEISEAVVLN